MKPAACFANLQLNVWAWLVSISLLTSTSSTRADALFPSTTEHSPILRAALVSLVREEDLSPVVTSIGQLEHTFNANHQYDWVFFSAEPLSDSFKAQTCNATCANCLFEVVSLSHGRASLGASA